MHEDSTVETSKTEKSRWKGKNSVRACICVHVCMHACARTHTHTNGIQKLCDIKQVCKRLVILWLIYTYMFSPMVPTDSSLPRQAVEDKRAGHKTPVTSERSCFIPSRRDCWRIWTDRPCWFPPPVHQKPCLCSDVSMKPQRSGFWELPDNSTWGSSWRVVHVGRAW